MSINNETAMTEVKGFNLPAVDIGDFTNDEIAEDMAGLQLSFQRVKIPSGGALQFEIPGDNPDDPDYAKMLEGVIVFNHAANGYWPDGNKDDENIPPLCQSVDGVTGVGSPGGACAACPMNKWGSGEKGKGKACKNMRNLYLLRDGDFIPLQLTLPPTSIKPFSDFYNIAFASRRRGTCGSVVQIGLKRMNNGKDDYSVATFKRLNDFFGGQLAQAKVYADSFRAQIREMLQQRVQVAEATADDVVVVGAPSYDEMFGGSEFTVSDTEIDGDRDELPQ